MVSMVPLSRIPCEEETTFLCAEFLHVNRLDIDVILSGAIDTFWITLSAFISYNDWILYTVAFVSVLMLFFCCFCFVLFFVGGSPSI